MQGRWRSCNNVYTTGVVVDKFDRLSAFNTAALVLCFGMNGGVFKALIQDRCSGYME